MPAVIPTRPRRRVRRPKPGTVKQVQAVMWKALQYLEAHLDDLVETEQADTNDLARITHAMSQAAGQYLKVIEVGELESTLQQLQKEFHEFKTTLSRPAGATAGSSQAQTN